LEMGLEGDIPERYGQAKCDERAGHRRCQGTGEPESGITIDPMMFVSLAQGFIRPRR
jgi:hypothetical protein